MALAPADRAYHRGTADLEPAAVLFAIPGARFLRQTRCSRRAVTTPGVRNSRRSGASSYGRRYEIAKDREGLTAIPVRRALFAWPASGATVSRFSQGKGADVRTLKSH